MRQVAEVHDRIEWWMFVCEECGEETFVGCPEGWSLEQFGQWALLMYGDPPVCSECLYERRVA